MPANSKPNAGLKYSTW